MSGHHSCMQMLQLFDIPNMQGPRSTQGEPDIFKKSPGKKTFENQTNQFSRKI